MSDPKHKPAADEPRGEPTVDSAEVIPFRRRGVNESDRPGAEPEVVPPRSAGHDSDVVVPAGPDGEPPR